MNFLLLLSLLSSSYRCSYVPDEISDFSSDPHQIFDYNTPIVAHQEASLLAKRSRDSFLDYFLVNRSLSPTPIFTYPVCPPSSNKCVTDDSFQNREVTETCTYFMDSSQKSYPETSTISSVSEDSSLSTKKRKFKQAEPNEIVKCKDTGSDKGVKTKYSAFITGTSNTGRVYFDLIAVCREFRRIPDRRSKCAFVNGLLMVKYREVFPKQRKNISWSKVEVLGWPDEVKFRMIYELNLEKILIILLSLNDIRFVCKKSSECRRLSKNENREANDMLHAKLVEACKYFNLTSNRGNIKWNELGELVPQLLLSGRNHRNWTEEDRKTIQNRILDELIPRLKREEEEEYELLALLD